MYLRIMTAKPFETRNANGVIRGSLTTPEGDLAGCLICLHGGPGGDLHGNTLVFDQIATRAAPLGFATIQVSMFGSCPSDGEARQTCLRTQTVDYLSILEFARRNLSCPIHVIGESAGATIASLNWLGEVASYVLLWPAFDLADTDLRPYLTDSWWKIVERDGHLDDNGVIVGKELFLELLLTDFASSFDLPSVDTLLVHGRCDEEVPYEQSLRALSRATGRVAFYGHDSADHGFKAPEHREWVLTKVETWLRER